MCVVVAELYHAVYMVACDVRYREGTLPVWSHTMLCCAGQESLGLCPQEPGVDRQDIAL